MEILLLQNYFSLNFLFSTCFEIIIKNNLRKKILILYGAISLVVKRKNHE